MPSELSKYIQDFIRPHKPVTENIKEIYEYCKKVILKILCTL